MSKAKKLKVNKFEHFETVTLEEKKMSKEEKLIGRLRNFLYEVGKVCETSLKEYNNFVDEQKKGEDEVKKYTEYVLYAINSNLHKTAEVLNDLTTYLTGEDKDSLLVCCHL